MNYETVMEALMYVDMLKHKQNDCPKELQDNRDLILYGANALQMKQGEYNYMYPLLKQGLNKQFIDYTRDMWVEYIGDVSSILDVGAGGGAYLNALPKGIAKYAIDNKPMGDMPGCTKYNGYFPDDMPKGYYDVIVMNEFLHLFELDKALELIQVALQYADRVVVVENHWASHLNYRLNKLGGGKLHTSDELELVNVVCNDRHYIGEVRL